MFQRQRKLAGESWVTVSGACFSPSVCILCQFQGARRKKWRDLADRFVVVGDGRESPAQVRCSPVFLLMMRNSSLPEMPEPAWTKIHWFSSSYWSLVFVLWVDTCQMIVPVVLLGWLALGGVAWSA
jgi:hypothetical protein